MLEVIPERNTRILNLRVQFIYRIILDIVYIGMSRDNRLTVNIVRIGGRRITKEERFSEGPSGSNLDSLYKVSRGPLFKLCRSFRIIKRGNEPSQ